MVVKMEQKDMNNLSPAELKAMADALLAADDEKQAKAKTKAAPAADKTAAADKPEAEKTTEEKLNELIERGKKAGKLSSKDLMVLEDMNLSSEETEKFYDRLESLGIDVLGDDALLPVDEDALPELEELEEIEEVTEEEMNETEAMADTFSTDDPVRMYLKEIGKVPLLTPEEEQELAKRMAADSELALHESLQAVLGFTPELAASVRQREDDTDRYEDTLGTFLVHLATQPMSEQDSVESSKLLHLIGDFERIADHAVNIIESAEELKEKGVSFTDSAKKELQTMLNAVSEIVDLTSRAFLQDDLTLARQVEPLEQVIDKLKNELRTNHIARLQRGECSLAAGFVLSDLLTNLERVADHCSNIAGCLLDMKNERIDLHKYLGDVKSGSNEFLMQYNTFEEKYKLA